MTDICDANKFKHRFRGYFPVVIDVETAGFNANTDALLEIAVSLLKMNSDGVIVLDRTLHFNIEPFEGVKWQGSISTIKKPIQHYMIPNVPLNYFASSLTDGKRWADGH